ncbi:hypothetical protein P4H15_29770 [Bacillus cereus]|nr:hypothetical protein [Bacillus cereus]
MPYLVASLSSNKWKNAALAKEGNNNIWAFCLANEPPFVKDPRVKILSNSESAILKRVRSSSAEAELGFLFQLSRASK